MHSPRGSHGDSIGSNFRKFQFITLIAQILEIIIPRRNKTTGMDFEIGEKKWRARAARILSLLEPVQLFSLRLPGTSRKHELPLIDGYEEEERGKWN